MRKMLKIFSVMLTLLAAVSVYPSSWLIFIHHPRVPKCLR